MCRRRLKTTRYPLLVVDEAGYIPFEAEAANLFFQLVSSRCERASLIVTGELIALMQSHPGLTRAG